MFIFCGENHGLLIRQIGHTSWFYGFFQMMRLLKMHFLLGKGVSTAAILTNVGKRISRHEGTSVGDTLLFISVMVHDFFLMSLDVR